jgi:hypothetical protein
MYEPWISYCGRSWRTTIIRNMVVRVRQDKRWLHGRKIRRISGRRKRGSVSGRSLRTRSRTQSRRKRISRRGQPGVPSGVAELEQEAGDADPEDNIKFLRRAWTMPGTTVTSVHHADTDMMFLRQVIVHSPRGPHGGITLTRAGRTLAETAEVHSRREEAETETVEGIGGASSQPREERRTETEDVDEDEEVEDVEDDPAGHAGMSGRRGSTPMGPTSRKGARTRPGWMTTQNPGTPRNTTRVGREWMIDGHLQSRGTTAEVKVTLSTLHDARTWR